jgi:hypothetical protein
MHPLHTEALSQKFLADTGIRIGHRHTGRSTARGLHAIANAIQNPGVQVPIQDHFGTLMADQHLARMIERQVAMLELKHLKVKFGLNGKNPYIIFGDPCVNNVPVKSSQPRVQGDFAALQPERT